MMDVAYISLWITTLLFELRYISNTNKYSSIFNLFVLFQSGFFGYTGVAEAVRTIYKKEGTRGLTCGLLPTLLRDAPFSGLYLMFYTQIKLYIPRGEFSSFFLVLSHF